MLTQFTDFYIGIFHNSSRSEQVFFKNNLWKHLTGMAELFESREKQLREKQA